MSRRNGSAAEKFDAREEKHDAFLTEFREAHADALAGAHVAAEHTATEGWRALYTDRVKAYEKARTDVAAWFKPLLEQLQRLGWYEDDEKNAKDLIKKAVEARETQDTFEATALASTLAVVNACRKVVEDFRFRARSEEQSNPLIAAGLMAATEGAIAATPDVTFDRETGRVEIKPRGL